MNSITTKTEHNQAQPKKAESKISTSIPLAVGDFGAKELKFYLTGTELKVQENRLASVPEEVSVIPDGTNELVLMTTGKQNLVTSKFLNTRWFVGKSRKCKPLGVFNNGKITHFLPPVLSALASDEPNMVIEKLVLSLPNSVAQTQTWGEAKRNDQILAEALSDTFVYQVNRAAPITRTIKQVVVVNEGQGVYLAVKDEGLVSPGEPISVLDVGSSTANLLYFDSFGQLDYELHQSLANRGAYRLAMGILDDRSFTTASGLDKKIESQVKVLDAIKQACLKTPDSPEPFILNHGQPVFFGDLYQRTRKTWFNELLNDWEMALGEHVDAIAKLVIAGGSANMFVDLVDWEFAVIPKYPQLAHLQGLISDYES